MSFSEKRLERLLDTFDRFLNNMYGTENPETLRGYAIALNDTASDFIFSANAPCEVIPKQLFRAVASSLLEAAIFILGNVSGEEKIIGRSMLERYETFKRLAQGEDCSQVVSEISKRTDKKKNHILEVL